MYIHLGYLTMARDKDIVGIFDMDITTVQKSTRDFLTTCEQNKKIISVSNELPKTFIVCKNKNIDKTYISPIAAGTLEKRLAKEYK